MRKRDSIQTITVSSIIAPIPGLLAMLFSSFITVVVQLVKAIAENLVRLPLGLQNKGYKEPFEKKPSILKIK